MTCFIDPLFSLLFLCFFGCSLRFLHIKIQDKRLEGSEELKSFVRREIGRHGGEKENFQVISDRQSYLSKVCLLTDQVRENGQIISETPNPAPRDVGVGTGSKWADLADLRKNMVKT